MKGRSIAASCRRHLDLLNPCAKTWRNSWLSLVLRGKIDERVTSVSAFAIIDVTLTLPATLLSAVESVSAPKSLQLFRRLL
jgi:hypothetical protein